MGKKEDYEEPEAVTPFNKLKNRANYMKLAAASGKNSTSCMPQGRGRMKLHSKFVWERFVLASRCFSSGATAIKIDRIP
jgi:hypothetical protein